MSTTRCLIEDASNRGQESHVSHTIRLINDDNICVGEFDDTLIDEVFEPVGAHWRGIGVLPDSGLVLREPYRELDAVDKYSLDMTSKEADTGCSCGSVLLGHILPDECPLFGSACNPEHPIGACMVSGEGSCAAYYKYQGGTA